MGIIKQVALPLGMLSVGLCACSDGDAESSSNVNPTAGMQSASMQPATMQPATMTPGASIGAGAMPEAPSTTGDGTATASPDNNSVVPPDVNVVPVGPDGSGSPEMGAGVDMQDAGATASPDGADAGIGGEVPDGTATPMAGDGEIVVTGGTENLPPIAEDKALPIVFVHGFAGSAQQYESQALRFAANGYPLDRVYAYDHNGEGFDVAGFIAGLDDVVDGALADTGASQVYLVGHSRGTFVSSTYLGTPANAAKVAKYISLDGSGCLGVPVPCIGPNQAMLPGQAHVEVSTSPESFEMQYEFLMGEAPAVVDIVQQSTPVTVSGRVLDFPANVGKDGSTLNVWEIDPATGWRVADEPLATFEIGPSGDFGPITVSPLKYYEMALTSSTSVQHFYTQRFLRDTTLFRLLSGPPDSPSRLNTNSGPGHSAMIVTRMREWMRSDVVEVSTHSPSGGDQEPANILTSGVGEANIAIHVHDDAASPGVSSLDTLSFFASQAFQSGVDLYMPASDPPDGTITLKNAPRGDSSLEQIINVPNWPSDGHLISVVFSDYPQPPLEAAP